MPSQPPLASLDYLAEVAKDWAISSFAAARDGTFALGAHRFEFDGTTVRRRPLSHRSPEATDPLAVAGRTGKPIAWARGDVATLFVDTASGSIAYEQEVVEILAVEQDEVLAEAACVVRVQDLPPCLGRFWTTA
jgi:hypothetical protein